MDEGKNLRKAIDAISGEALDDAMNLVFSSNTEESAVDDRSEIVGRYKLLEKIGEGGFGVVYMAEQQEPIRRRVALKVIKLGMDTRQVVARFEAERQALAMMDHENIASALDAGSTETGRPYFVMELARGVAITAYCDRNRLTTDQRLELFVPVCKAVQHAHQKGIIHRDIKPNNVMVTLRDGVPIPKVIDFGVAKATQVRLTDKTLFTRSGQFIGTPAYMSPEQIEMSEMDIDTRSDIYSLGVVLYELLTGTTPFDVDKLRWASYSEMQQIICEQDPPKPSDRLSQSGEALPSISAHRGTEPKKLGHILRGELDWIVMKALEKDRTRRYETANGLAEDLLRYLHNEPVSARPPSVPYLLRKFAAKNRKLISAVTVFMMLLLASTVVSTWLSFRAMRAENRAIHNQNLANERFLQETRAKEEMAIQRDLANKLGKELQRQLAETDKAAERARNLLYVAHMNLIQQEFVTGNQSRIIELLNHHRPQPGRRDLRGFEWYYAWGLCHRHPWNWQHHASVTSVAVSPNGKYVVSGCSDGRLETWDVKTGQVVAAINGHDNIVFNIAFLPKGRTILTCSHDQTVRRWTIRSGRLESSGPAMIHASPFECAAVSPDGTLLVVGGVDPQIWNLKTRSHRALDSDLKPVRSAAFTRDGSSLVLGGSSPNVQVVDLTANAVARTIETGLVDVVSVACSPAEETLVFGDSRGAIELWNDKSGIRHLGNHSGTVHALRFSQDAQVLATAGSDSLIMLWDVQRKNRIDILRGHADDVHAVGFARKGTALVTASADNTVKLWDLTRGQARVNLDSHRNPVTSITFPPQSSRLMASGSLDGEVRLWDITAGKTVETLSSYGGPVRCLAMSPDGSTIACGGGALEEPGNVLLWDRYNKVFKRTASEHSRAVLAVAFSPDGETFASGGDDGLLIFWDAATLAAKTKLENYTEAVVSLAYSPKGELLATSSFRQHDVTLWNTANPMERRILSGHEDWITSVAFSPDGNLLASGSIDLTVRIWDVASGNERFVLAGHGRAVEAVAFSPDGSTLASAGRDGQLKLWDVATGEEKGNLECQPESSGMVLAFSPTGRKLAAAGNSSVIIHQAASDVDLHIHEEPRVPQNHLPLPGSVIEGDQATLQPAPFSHRHAAVTHSASHWQLRASDATYSVPIVNQLDTQSLSRLIPDRGILLPNTTYFWRVAYAGSNHTTSRFSAETSFRTADFALKSVPFDLSAQFNRDIVKNPGDDHTDSIDSSAGSHLVVTGFDGTQTYNTRVDGLPVDRRVGPHILGHYSKNNAIQTGLADKSKPAIRISVPNQGYDLLRFLVVGGNGNSDIPVRIEYEDGSSHRELVLCDDWFHDITTNRYGMLRAGLLPRINEMDRCYAGEFRDENAAAVFEFIVRVDPAKTMVAIELETDSDDALYSDTALRPDHTRTRFNLLAVTGISVAP